VRYREPSGSLEALTRDRHTHTDRHISGGERIRERDQENKSEEEREKGGGKRGRGGRETGTGREETKKALGRPRSRGV
jgi:hypothetical protein